MSKFMLLYKGPATDMSTMSEEKRNQIMQQWDTWMKQVGAAMVEMGSPMGPGVSLVDDGSAGTTDMFTGYSIVEANDMDGAKALIVDHPFLSDHTGKFSVDVFELLPMPAM